MPSLLKLGSTGRCHWLILRGLARRPAVDKEELFIIAKVRDKENNVFFFFFVNSRLDIITDCFLGHNCDCRTRGRGFDKNSLSGSGKAFFGFFMYFV